MDIGFLIVAGSFFVGPIVVAIGAVLVIWRRTRWYAASVLIVAVVAASLVTLAVEGAPYAPHAVFIAAFSFAAIAIGALVSLVWAVVATIDTWEHRHAA